MAGVVNIRVAQKADVPELYRLEQLCFETERFSRRHISYLVSRSEGEFLVLTENSNIAGFMILLVRRSSLGVRIYSLAVSPEYRGNQYAKQLILKAGQVATNLGKSFLHLEVSQANFSAIQLYRKLGFQITGKRERYYKDGSDAWLMRLGLNPSKPS